VGSPTAARPDEPAATAVATVRILLGGGSEVRRLPDHAYQQHSGKIVPPARERYPVPRIFMQTYQT
jgi:hypothetical protein